MIKYLCDIKDCGQEAPYPDTEKEWVGNEMVDVRLDGASYFWARFGFANITLCKVHRKEAVRALVNALIKKYGLE
jgi:hypothetical protein